MLRNIDDTERILPIILAKIKNAPKIRCEDSYYEFIVFCLAYDTSWFQYGQTPICHMPRRQDVEKVQSIVIHLYSSRQVLPYEVHNQFNLTFQIMQMHKLNRCLQGSNVTVLSVHPGIVETEINRSFSDLGRWKVFFGLSKLVGVTKTPFEGAKSSINAAINPQLAGIRDVYYADCKPTNTVPIARKLENQESLWEYSKERLKDYLPEDVVKELEDNTPI